ncbi:MAG: N-acetyl sugar amidotransferase [Saprospiraceae bacterium]|nr:N-acetyl sugar amidotransferase [Saprospiraceae bacterium]
MEQTVISCKQCVMDSIGNPEIRLDAQGICNYCHEYREKEAIRLLKSPEREKALNALVARIKKAGEGKPYDCLIGVSGGVDSTFTAYFVKKLGLRPLAVHFDNGWNSELAVHNIQKVLENLDIDLFTYVVNWNEFKDLQMSFLKASTPDGEIPTDHAILATLYQVAGKHNIKFIMSGNNFKTEGIMPRLWAYGHIDWAYIRGIHKKFGTKKLKTFPHFTLTRFLWYTLVKRVKMISILNYMDYDKDEAMRVLLEELNWQYYGGKHYESNYTKFYQGIILPQKFHIDKRKIHLSALILAGQLSREEALSELEKPIYPLGKIDEDKEYVCKKFGISAEELEKIMSDSPKTFMDYPNSYGLHQKFRNILLTLRKKKLLYS